MKHFLNLFKACLAVALILLAGCATTAKYEKVLNTWNGAPESELVKYWGPPDSIYTVDSNTKMLTYYSSSLVTFPGISPSYETIAVGNNVIRTNTFAGIPAETTLNQCKTWFTITKGRVTRSQWKGSDCVSS